MVPPKLTPTCRVYTSGFFLKIFDGGGLKIFGPCRSPTGMKSDGGGTSEKNPTEAKTAHLMQN